MKRKKEIFEGGTVRGKYHCILVFVNSVRFSEPSCEFDGDSRDFFQTHICSSGSKNNKPGGGGEKHEHVVGGQGLA